MGMKSFEIRVHISPQNADTDTDVINQPGATERYIN